MNELLSQKRHLCAFLNIKRIVSSFLVMVQKQNTGYIERQYRVLLETFPGGAFFEGTTVESSGVLEVVNGISRLTMHRRQSYCIKDTNLQQFCFCKDLLTR